MAKDDFDLGPEFDDFSSEFDDLNFDDPVSTNTKSNRDPVTQVKQGLTSGLSAAGKSIGPKLASKIDQNIPNVGSLVGEGMQLASGVQATAQKFARDVNPSILQLKRSARIVAPKLTKYLPEKVSKRIDELLKTEQSVSGKVSVEASRKAEIDESLALIFAAQEKRAQTTYVEDRAERMLDKTTEKIRHEDMTKLVDSIRVATEFQKNFTSTVGIGYLKKSLELKYQHLFVAKDTLSTVQGMAKVLETKLEQIRHNSALPDIQKQHLSESYKDVMRQSVSQRLNQHLSGWGGRILKNIQSKILDPVVQGLDMAAGGADMYASMSEAMEGFGPQETAAQKVGGFVGGLASGRIASWLSKKAFGDGTTQGMLSPYGRSVGDIASQTKLRLLLKSKELQENAEPGSFTGFLADILAPGINRGGGVISNDMLNPTDAVPFDRSVRQSIVEIIPGYLAKSVQLLTKLATGEDAEELTYDHTKRDFVSVSDFRSRVVNEAFGDAVSRGRQMGELVGTYRGVTAAAGKDVAKFDEMSQDIATVLTHHALKKYLLNPKVLQKYVEGEELSDKEQNYISRVFEGIENRRAVATAMIAPLISTDGKVDLIAEERINRVIIAIMGSDSYLDTLPKYLHGLGQSRHLGDLFESDGAGFAFNQKRIREILFGGSRDEYASSVTDTSDRIKRFLDQDADEKSATPEFVRKLFKPIFGDPTEREKAPDATADGLTPETSAAVAVIAKEIEKRNQSTFSYDPTRSSGARYALGSNLPAVINAGYRGPRYTSLLDSEDIRPGIVNSDIIDAEVYESTRGTTGTSSSGLEGIFKEHAERQHPVPDLLQKILDNMETNTKYLGEINDKVLSMLAEIGDGFFGKLTHRGKDFGKSQLDKLMRLKTKAQAKIKDAAEGMYLRALYGKDKIRDKGDELYLRMLYGKDYLLGNQLAGTQGILGRLTGGLVGAGGTLAGAGASVLGRSIGKYQDFRNSWDKRKEDFAKKYRGTYKRGLVKGRRFGRKIKSAANLNFRYVDIYLKDKVEPGKPLLTKKKQIEGVIFSNGKKVQSSYDIKLPVLDPVTGDTLITEEDISIGLVDIENRSLSTGLSAISLLKRGFGSTFGGLSKLKDLFSSSNPLAKLVGSAGSAFFDLVGAGGKFGFKAFSKMFGLDDTSINKEILQSVVGDKLDAILEFLKSRFGDGNIPPTAPQTQSTSPVSSDITAGDRDGDGKRDTIFEELVAKDEEKKEARAQAAQLSMADSLKKLVDYSAKQLDTAKSTLKVQKEVADEAGGGIIDKILGFLGLRSAAGGLGTMIKGAGGALLAKVGLGGLFGGGAAAAAGAASTTAAAGAATTSAAVATGGIGAAMSGMGGALAASLASNPVGWAIGGTILAAGAAYAGYKWLNPSGDLGIETRAKIYGIKLDESTGMFSESMTAKVISLEEETDSILDNKSAPMNDSSIRNWAGRFGFDVKNAEEIRYWATWYRQRFVPAFRIYISLVKQAGYTYSNVDDIPEESIAAIEKVFLDRVGPHVQQYKDLTPDKNGYAKYQRALKKLEEDAKKSGGVDLTEEEIDAAQTGRTAQSDTTRYSSKYSSTTVRSAAAARMSNGDYDTPTGKEKQQQAKSPSFWEKTKSFFGFGSGGSGQNVEPVDTSGYNPPPPDSNELGALSAKFESAKLGSLAIGFDGTGGTSYGKYQIATRTGTFNRFLKFAASAGGDGTEVAKRLQNAGDPDTGGKNGSVPNEWKKLVMEGKMGDLEHKFIKATHYDPAFGGLNPELRSMVEKSKALQDVLWSTAVQHGPAGAKSIFNSAFAQAGSAPTPDQIIKLVYGHRGNKFPSSTAAIQSSVKSRFRTEAAMALAMLAKEKTTPGNENPDQPPASGTKYEVPAAEGTPQSVASTTSQQKAPGIDTTRDSTANAPQSAVANSNTGTGSMPASPISSATTDVTTPSAKTTSGSADSGVAELKQLNASMTQLLKSIDALVVGQNVLSEIRDGINSGFADVRGMSSGSSDSVKSAVASQSASSSAVPTSTGPGAPAIPMRRASRRSV